MSDFDGDARLVVPFGDTEVGVFRRDGNLCAYENFCLHQGRPACEGMVMHFLCPWHGSEYDLATGECAADRRLRLKPSMLCSAEILDTRSTCRYDRHAYAREVVSAVKASLTVRKIFGDPQINATDVYILVRAKNGAQPL